MAAPIARDGWFKKASKNVGRRLKRFFKTLLEWRGIIGLGVALILVGVVLLERYHASESIPAKLVGLFVSELGFACLIAAIIFAMIEEWAAREHCKTAIGHLYGVRPAGRFFKKIEEYVLKQPYYRGKVIVEYFFEKQEGEHILVRYSAKYDVTNICTNDDVKELVVGGRLAKKPLHTGITAWDAQLGVVQVTIDGQEFSGDSLAVSDDEAKRTQSYHVKEKKALAFSESAQVEAVHYLVKHDHDAAAWTTSAPARKVELRLRWDPAMRIKFAAEAIHPEADELKEEKGENSLTLKLDEPFLQGHGFHFWWSPELAEETAPAQALPEDQVN